MASKAKRTGQSLGGKAGRHFLALEPRMMFDGAAVATAAAGAEGLVPTSAAAPAPDAGWAAADQPSEERPTQDETRHTALADTPEDTPLSVAATAGLLANDNDIDGNTLTVTQFTVAGDTTVYAAAATATIANVGTLTINADGSYTFAPAANYNGTVPVVTYTVSDGTASSTATLSLTVTPVNDPPIAANDTGTTRGGRSPRIARSASSARRPAARPARSCSSGCVSSPSPPACRRRRRSRSSRRAPSFCPRRSTG
ncbi:cadherin-like domain-containing protein [Sphingomonas lycopersici]|uniref:Cadherin-like domain-containing protein n=1 Tax=Sphingomonas lycopersici TaxID=2951807 RepID=A0AA41ZBL6_9SPHN|nr:cadherin-like domain-containing protein [Sphingomonas lycopersici]